MPQTPRFVSYTDNGKEYIIHMYPPRFVAMVTGKDTVAMHEQWDDDSHTEVSIEEATKKMCKWLYYTRNKRQS